MTACVGHVHESDCRWAAERRLLMAAAVGPGWRELLMRRRVPVAAAAALVAAFLVAFPVLADSEYAGVERSMDWRLVVIFVALGLFAFYAALQFASRDRR